MAPGARSRPTGSPPFPASSAGRTRKKPVRERRRGGSCGKRRAASRDLRNERPVGDDARVLAEPERYRELALAALRRREIARERAIEPRLLEPAGDLLPGKSEAAVRLALAQELEGMR